MPLRYACFVSYRHRPGQLYKDTLDDLCTALRDELAFWVNEDVYLDTERLKGGDFFDKGLARALCESCCMVVVYIPTYFDKSYTYCAREYRAMEQLERKRLKLVGRQPQEHGLIIPIICRDWDRLPHEIRQKRQCYNFEPYLLSKRLIDHAEAREAIQRIAKYIRDRFVELQDGPSDPCANCDNFVLPAEKSIIGWLRGVEIPKLGFPR